MHDVAARVLMDKNQSPRPALSLRLSARLIRRSDFSMVISRVDSTEIFLIESIAYVRGLEAYR